MDRKENYDYNACDELRCMDGVVFEYDLKGNMTKKIDPSEGVTQYAYDYQNRLFRITYPDKTQSRYYYNSSGLRTAKADGIEPRPDGSASSVGRTTYYYWDGTEIESIPNAINESDETGGITNTCWPEIGFKSINNSGSATGSSATAGGSSAGGSGFAGGGLGTAGGGQWRFFITDHLGSVIALTDESGNITDQYEYDEYGALIKAKGTSHNPYRYIGQSCDDTTGLLYLRARYYDPRTGRFVNRDPIGIFGGINHYLYASNNPVQFIDLTGTTKVGISYLFNKELKFFIAHGHTVKGNVVYAGIVSIKFDTVYNTMHSKDFTYEFNIRIAIYCNSNSQASLAERVKRIQYNRKTTMETINFNYEDTYCEADYKGAGMMHYKIGLQEIARGGSIFNGQRWRESKFIIP